MPAPAEEEEEADVGPTLPKAKKRKVLEYEQQYLHTLPLSGMYEKSYMHRDTVTQVAVAQATDFFVTASADGHIKFWKKQPQGIEFAKHYKAHLGPVTGLAVSSDGTLCASISTDRTAKVFDVASFDMIAMLRLPFVPGCVEWCSQASTPRGDAKAKLAVSDSGTGLIHIYDMRSASNEPVDELPSLHSEPVTAMRYNEAADAVISTDAKGVIEYWSASTYRQPEEEVQFRFKLDTGVPQLLSRGLPFTAQSMCSVAPPRRKVRVFRFATGKLSRTYDESLQATNELQRSQSELYRLDPIDYGRRVAVEKELAADPEAPKSNAVFDESGNFLLYATLLGIKVINLVTSRVVRIIGKVESTERFLSIALYQVGRQYQKSKRLPVGPDTKLPQPDPTLLCCAYGKQRLYLFTQREP
ncbi:hypothetical protein CHLNCDRAFT_28079, partial [Chlorella variabilis]